MLIILDGLETNSVKTQSTEMHQRHGLPDSQMAKNGEKE